MVLNKRSRLPFMGSLGLVIGVILTQGCASGPAPEGASEAKTVSLPVLEIVSDSVTTYKGYTASLEGKINIEIRAQATALQSQLDVVDIKRQEINAYVEPYSSLGGGWK